MLKTNITSAECSPRLAAQVWTIVLGAGLAAQLGGCIVVDDHDDDHHHIGDPYGSDPPPPLSSAPAQVTIDAGATLEITPGDGVGIFVTYEAGGRWEVTTACDTTFSGFACAFSVHAAATDIALVSEQALEADDIVDVGSNEISLYADTSFGTDGIVVETASGAPLRLEVYLDGQSEPRFVYWVGGDVLHAGAPTNPIDFLPDVP